MGPRCQTISDVSDYGPTVLQLPMEMGSVASACRELPTSAVAGAAVLAPRPGLGALRRIVPGLGRLIPPGWELDLPRFGPPTHRCHPRSRCWDSRPPAGLNLDELISADERRPRIAHLGHRTTNRTCSWSAFRLAAPPEGASVNPRTRRLRNLPVLARLYANSLPIPSRSAAILFPSSKPRAGRLLVVLRRRRSRGHSCGQNLCSRHDPRQLGESVHGPRSPCRTPRTRDPV